jgi:hypothetical protein
MAYDESLKSITLNVDSSLGFYTGIAGMPGSLDPNSGKMYCFVKIVADRQVGLSTVATDKVVGILQNKPQNAGMAGTIGIFGVSNVLAGAAVNYGDHLAPDSTGRAVHDDTNGKWMALASTTVVGAMIPALKL